MGIGERSIGDVLLLQDLREQTAGRKACFYAAFELSEEVSLGALQENLC